MTELNQPHDRFFSKAFSRVDIAEDILINNITALADLIVPGSLEFTGEKFVNAELDRFYSDLLMKAQLKNQETAFIYFLVEHKSFLELQISFDLLKYMIQIWDKVKEKGKPLPFVFPVVIYHGKQKWKAGTNFSGLVKIPAGMEEYTPRFNYYLLDLSQFKDEDLKGTILSRVVLLLMKHIYDDDFGEQFISICGLLAELHEEKTALEFMRSIVEYAGNASDKLTRNQMREGVKKALPQTGDEIMPTLFEEIRQEGRQEGRREGLLKGIQLALELQYGAEGLDLYPQIENYDSEETLNRVEDALRKKPSLEDFKLQLSTIIRS